MRGISKDPAIIEGVQEILSAGGSFAECKRQLNISYTTISKICQMHGISRAQNKPRQFSPEQVNMLKKLAAEGKLITQLVGELEMRSQIIRDMAAQHGVHIFTRAELEEKKAAEAKAEAARLAATKVRSVPRPKPVPRKILQPQPCLVATYGLSAADRAALVQTKGKYTELATWAAERGLSIRQAQQRWHALGLGLETQRQAHD